MSRILYGKRTKTYLSEFTPNSQSSSAFILTKKIERIFQFLDNYRQSLSGIASQNVFFNHEDERNDE